MLTSAFTLYEKGRMSAIGADACHCTMPLTDIEEEHRDHPRPSLSPKHHCRHSGIPVVLEQYGKVLQYCTPATGTPQWTPRIVLLCVAYIF